MTSEAVLPPYRGIRPYRYVDRTYYFGREDIIDDLTAKVLLYRLVVLFGESGVGKSSLINAGLIAALKAKGFQPERLRVRPFEAHPISVERVSGGMGPHDGFLESIFDEGAEPQSPPPQVIDQSLEQFKATIEGTGDDTHPVLILDQFEELFTLFDQKDGKAPLGELQARLLDMIVGIISDPELKVKIVIAIREDYLARLDVLARHYPQVFDHRVLLEQLDKDDAAKAILCPFRGALTFQSRLTSKLAVTIIKELASSQLDECIHPTELQIVCSRLWDNFADSMPAIGTAQFKAMGGTRGIIEGFLASELAALAAVDERLRNTAVAVLFNLITDSATRDVVSRQKLIGALEDIADDTFLDRALDVLEERRLINSISERGTVFYELSSEFLIGPIQKERERHVLQQAQERERAKILRWFGYAAIAVGIILIFVYLLAQERARGRAHIAELEKKNEEAIVVNGALSDMNLQSRLLISNLSDLASEDSAKRQAARDNIARDAEIREIPIAILPLIDDLVRRKDQDIAEKYLTNLTQAILKSPIAVAAEPVANPVRVYIQISGDEQLGPARQAKVGLERNGVVVGIRRVSHGPKATELRYFIAEDKDAANQVAAQLRGFGVASVSNVQAVYVSGYENSTLVQPQQYELWFPGLPQPTPTPSPDDQILPESGGFSLGRAARQDAWFVAVYPESASLMQRAMLLNVVYPIAIREGASAKLYGNAVKIGPYQDRERADQTRKLVVEAVRATAIKLLREPSLTSGPTLK